MKYFALSLIAFAASAHAQNVVTGTEQPAALYAGAGTGKPLVVCGDFIKCSAEAARRKLGSYTIKAISKVVVAAPPPPVELVKVWVNIGTEGGNFTLTETTAVRYGAGSSFSYKILPAGTYRCNSGDAFGSGDPAPGRVKVCEKQIEVVPMPTTVDHSGHGPVINRDLIPGPKEGFNTARIRSVWVDAKGAECAPDTFGCVVPDAWKFVPGSDIGAFREPCGFSHMNFDDFIVHPGKPGVAHLHTYWGNTSASANSTPESLDKATSTCHGGTLNRTAYWMPSMIDTATGRPVTPGDLLAYYKGNYQFDASGLVQAYPKGLRMIAGNAANTDPTKALGSWTCYAPDGTNGPTKSTITQAIASGHCRAGGRLHLGLPFPYCWDGVNLDSPNHADHMSNIVYDVKTNKFSCPTTHPKVLPNLAYNTAWDIGPGDDVSKWKLSSDKGEAGASVHGDYDFRWDKDTNERWVQNCLRKKADGHASLTCDGYTLY